MIIRHSLLLLEQLTELEILIESIEKLMREQKINVEREQDILRILNGRNIHLPRPLRKELE